MSTRYVYNGTSYAVVTGAIPPGCWEVSKEEFDAAAMTRENVRAEYVAALLASRAELRASAKAKLVAGEPLTDAEAELVLG